ncbi:RNA 2',3'-cyclic phosphodiesterase [Sunxiuqinia rutila]|uniref:RNA 2',3'-cyclic phosphodiesterase n=1 Tax=Sunxiuqinia rutila TaxID=1397841 RepID=UPI003D36556D
MEVKRVFIAFKINLQPVLQQHVQQLKQELKQERIRWVPEENQHLTIRFLGDLSANQLGEVKAVLNRVARHTKSFSFQLGGLAYFRHRGIPSVIFLGVQTDEILVELAKKLRAELENAGIESSKKYNPHLTLGRLKRPNNVEHFEATMEKLRTTAIQNVIADELILYESHLSPSGSKYHVLGKYTLG